MLIRFCLILSMALSMAFCGGISRPAAGGEFNRVLSIGDPAPRWSALPAVMPPSIPADNSSSEDQEATLQFEDFADHDVLVIVFTCNSCPYAVDAEDRLIALQTWLAERDGQLVAINVNNVEEDLLEPMRIRASEKGFNFPYLYDNSQQLARAYGATTTPELLVLDRQRKVVYMGSLDDSPDGQAVKTSHVRDAVTAILAGRPAALAETVPIGCRIRFDRVRRSKKTDQS